ncbi:thermonuclease family protein [Sphaerothrix gracilis]|uniref:thermonuclease family protein n=1 Tax=Sphaerothrix gracilis TaxID=3151835 RepID=UPI0031FC50C9
MSQLKTRGLIPLLILGAIAATAKWLPESVTEAIATALPTDSMPVSEHYQLVPGSVYDGDTLRVTDGTQELKIRLCGIDAPEMEQPLGEASRNHLRSLINQGDGTLIVLPVERDRYGRTVAELFVATSTGEIHLNSQMTLDGYAYHYERYSDSCPNQSAIALGEEQARLARVGVWASPGAVTPWEYREAERRR